MKKTLFFSLLVMLPMLFVTAQTSLVPYQWESHGLKFKVPASSDILEQNSTRFVVDNPELRVEIEAYDGPELDSDTISEVLIGLAEAEGIIFDDSSEIQQFSNTGLQGVSIEGDRTADKIAVAVLLSEYSNRAVAVKVIYGTGLENVANDIINSFSMSK